jgi:hypothetical protein
MRRQLAGAVAAMGSLIGHLVYGSLFDVIANAPAPHVAHG